MNCRRVISLLSAYIDGEMNGIDMLAVREHISHCKTCREDYESLRATKQLLARMPTATAGDDLLKKIFSHLDAIEMPTYLRLWSDLRSGFHIKLSPAFAAMATVAIAILFLGARGRTPQTYDVARNWKQIPKPIALTLTDLAKSEFSVPDATIPSSWQVKAPNPITRPSIVLASFTQ